MPTNDFKQLTVWQKSMRLTMQIYRITDNLPNDEMYGLTSQLKKSAVSIQSNIAEGSRRDYCKHLFIARGSAAELETQLLIAQKIYKCNDYQHSLKLLKEIQKMLNTMIKKLKS